MAHLIHAKQTPEGMRFRVWSSSVDAYLTGEMSEEEISEWMLGEAVRAATEKHKMEFPLRIARASQNGTSCLLGSKRDINGPWKQNRK